MSAAVQVVLAEDPSRVSLRPILREIPTVAIVAEATDGRVALPLIATHQPDVALVDTALPGMNGFDVVERAHREHPRTRVLVVSTEPERSQVAQALRLGASGYLLKTAADRAELDVAIRAVASGHAYLSPAVTKPVVEVFVRSLTGDAVQGPFPQLSPRQHEILQLIAKGDSTREIAQHLGLSIKTIETHRAQLMRRLDIRDVAGLVRYAIRAGIITADK
ncbi:MAG TPA: response regulator transcription factor [Gemmatimonadales bacterium]